MEKRNFLDGLNDIGCTKEQIDNFVDLEDQGKRKEQLQLLSQKKKKLLDNLHDSQTKIDCIDYLMFELKKDL